MGISRRKFLAWLAAGAGASALSFDSLYLENNWPEATFYKWPTKKWPAGLKPLRMMLLSDLHLKKFGAYERKILKMAAELRPELLVITGDFIESNDKFPELKSWLAGLPTNCPKFAVLGNWDHWSGVSVMEFDKTFAGYGIKLLDNSRVRLNSEYGNICIIGVDDPTNGWEKPEKAASQISGKEFNLFLAHSPNIISRLKGLPIDLLLCGHTHGGQVRIPGIKPFWLPRRCEGYVAGFYERDGIKMYVSKGLGNSVVPIRFLCRPEITVFEIRAKEQA